LLLLFENYLHNRKQRVILNGVTSSWKPVQSGVPQGSVLGPLLFLIFINDLPENIVCQPKLFADDVSLNAVMFDHDEATGNLNADLKLIYEWSIKWKMVFNPDVNKPAEEIVFTNRSLIPYDNIVFNNANVKAVDSHKHLGLILDTKLNFNKHIDEKISKANKGIGIIRRLYPYLPRKSLIQIYKSYIRPHLDYCDIIYHKPIHDEFTREYFSERASADPIRINEQFNNKIETVQYNSALAITGCIRGTSKQKLYSELGLVSLYDRRTYHRFLFFYKIVNDLAPQYLKKFIPGVISNLHNVRRHRETWIRARTLKFRYSFFPHCINSWNHLSSFIKTSPSINIFKKRFMAFFGVIPNPVYGILNPLGLKYLTRLRVGLSHLRVHKFHHNFSDTIHPFCSCNEVDVESIEHYLLHCPNYLIFRSVLFENLRKSISLVSLINSKFTCDLLLFGNHSYDVNTNRMIILETIQYLISTKRFDQPLIEGYGP
jgi:hypothetical protein